MPWKISIPHQLWLGYVDDIFSMLKKNVVGALLKHLNQQHPSIQFTLEEEKNQQLPFMDVRVHRGQNKLKTSIYRKPTHTGRYLNYSSNHPVSAKRAVAYALINRMDHITLEGEQTAEEERIKEDLRANGLPETFFNETRRKSTRRISE